MRHQEASTIVDAPPRSVETRLSDVTSWPAFLDGVDEVERLGHERYLFRLADGRDRREVIVCVRHLVAEHAFIWRALEGPRFHGRLDLRPTDDGRHTVVRLSIANHPGTFLAGLAEMVLPRMSRAAKDLDKLDQLLHR